jgi:hypothetical protein
MRTRWSSLCAPPATPSRACTRGRTGRGASARSYWRYAGEDPPELSRLDRSADCRMRNCVRRLLATCEQCRIPQPGCGIQGNPAREPHLRERVQRHNRPGSGSSSRDSRDRHPVGRMYGSGWPALRPVHALEVCAQQRKRGGLGVPGRPRLRHGYRDLAGTANRPRRGRVPNLADLPILLRLNHRRNDLGLSPTRAGGIWSPRVRRRCSSCGDDPPSIVSARSRAPSSRGRGGRPAAGCSRPRPA